jgi:hypothetical protein
MNEKKFNLTERPADLEGRKKELIEKFEVVRGFL